MRERSFSPDIAPPRAEPKEWRVFPLDRGAVVITGAGQDLLAENSGFASLLHRYRTDVINFGQNPPDQRRYFRHGGNSDVYRLGETSVVVKESTNTQSSLFALERMDVLQTVCDAELPGHIRVPKHYGAVYSADLKRQYTFMEKANEGVTIEDIQSSPDYPDATQIAVMQEFGQAKVLLDEALARHNATLGIDRNYLPDWHVGNVIADFTIPTKQFPFTLWIIDQ